MRGRGLKTLTIMQRRGDYGRPITLMTHVDTKAAASPLLCCFTLLLSHLQNEALPEPLILQPGAYA